ncbi:Serine/Threonine protein kinase with WD40 repeats [Nostoc sp. NIES-3756]|uniref:tetratricopeptide repeat protein n=1 Tax=Nostoc sp. NIES-3756 TaxID=1751286 RepID=UPI0007211C59|nr:tetratricopeptide repeat protein [Nostoc sp. NIES-3756]BAT54051.1 Serine/Threonine protein kinase with WD40 repeats [Nostoc sp. NIES-3756]BAY38210.1 serine/threonine protein kinase with WD-40 repeats [Nostoc sp. NIES-2111]
MTYYYDSKGRYISLEKRLASSGEGEVWQTNFSGYLAKIYHFPKPEHLKKLQLMLANPPEDPTNTQNHISIAWVKDLLMDGNGNCVGFIMPAINQAKELLYVYNPQYRLKQAPGFNWYYLHTAAYNLALIISELHAKGYIVGDINPKNILVNDQGLISIIDTDSFQVSDSIEGIIYRCAVGLEGFTPPELLNKNLSSINQTRYHDRFRLAVVIHHLLFGYHPFIGKWTGYGDVPEQNELIRQGFWLYGRNTPLQLTQNIIPLKVVHPEIQKLFLKCFNDGHNSPILRPSAQDWCNALKLALSDLKTCVHIANHSYSKIYGNCYWCERTNQLGCDIFPNITNYITPAQIELQLQQQISNSNFSSVTKKIKLIIKLEQKNLIQSINKKKYAIIKAIHNYLTFIFTKKNKLIAYSISLIGILLIKIIILDVFIPFFTINWYSQQFLEPSKGKIKISNKSISLDYRSQIFYQRGIKNYRKRKYEQAINDFENVLIINYQNTNIVNKFLTKAYFERGKTKAKNGQYVTAISDYNQALSLIQKDAEIYYQRGLAYSQIKKYEFALNNYKQAIYLAPYKSEYYNTIGVTYHRIKNYTLAVESFNKAIALDSSISYFYSNRGLAFYQLKSYQTVVNDLNKAIQINPSDANYYNLRGFANFNLNSFQSAIKDFTKAIELNPEEPSFYTNRGGVYEKTGNIQSAIQDFQTAAEMFLRKGNKEEYQKRKYKITLIKSLKS